MDLNLTGKTALITGASKGIGLAIARMLAREGCHLHLAARSDSDLRRVADELSVAFGTTVVTHAVDLSKNSDVHALARRCPDPDILVNNAGAIPFGRLLDIDEARWRAGWDLKIFGTIDLTRAVYAGMRARQRGVIVNVIGVAGERPRADYITGSTGNAGLMAFSRALGAESVDHGVRVVAVNPGRVVTERLQPGLEIEAQKLFGDRSRWREVPTKPRMGQPEEIADVVAFLASPRASYISGTVVTADGGLANRNSE